MVLNRTIERNVVYAIVQQVFDLPVLLLVMHSQNLDVFWQLIASYPKTSVFIVQFPVNSHKMFDFHLVFFQSVQQLLFDIWPVNVNGLFNWNLNRNLTVDIHWNFTVDVDWLVYIHDFLSDCGYFHCLDYLLLDLKWNFLFDFDVFRHLDDFLDDSFRTWNWSWYLHNDLNRFLHNHFLDNLFGDNTFVSIDLSVSIF